MYTFVVFQGTTLWHSSLSFCLRVTFNYVRVTSNNVSPLSYYLEHDLTHLKDYVQDNTAIDNLYAITRYATHPG